MCEFNGTKWVTWFFDIAIVRLYASFHSNANLLLAGGEYDEYRKRPCVGQHQWRSSSYSLLLLLRTIGSFELMMLFSWRLSTTKIKRNVRIEEMAAIHSENMAFRHLSNILIGTNASSGTLNPQPI